MWIRHQVISLPDRKLKFVLLHKQLSVWANDRNTCEIFFSYLSTYDVALTLARNASRSSLVRYCYKEYLDVYSDMARSWSITESVEYRCRDRCFTLCVNSLQVEEVSKYCWLQLVLQMIWITVIEITDDGSFHSGVMLNPWLWRWKGEEVGVRGWEWWLWDGEY